MPQLAIDDIENAIEVVGTEVSHCLRSVPIESLASLASCLMKSNRLFFAGEGRSGFVAKMAAMRMMHLGLQAYVVGETTTPSVTEGDLLLIVSGSGETSVISLLARRARASGVTLALVTTRPDSDLAKEASVVIEVKAQSKVESLPVSRQFAGSLFEQTALLALDSVFYALTRQVSAATLMNRHANLE